MLLGESRAAYALQEFSRMSPEDVASGNLLHDRILRDRDSRWLEN